MRLAQLEALERRTGFRVVFEILSPDSATSPGVVTTRNIRPDMIPEADEEPVESLKDAWILAERVAKVGRGEFVNVYPIHDYSREPVERGIHNRLNPWPPTLSGL